MQDAPSEPVGETLELSLEHVRHAPAPTFAREKHIPLPRKTKGVAVSPSWLAPCAPLRTLKGCPIFVTCCLKSVFDAFAKPTDGPKACGAARVPASKLELEKAG